MTRLVIVALAASLLGACAPTLRQSICFAAMPGVTVCQFAYEGDETE